MTKIIPVTLETSIEHKIVGEPTMTTTQDDTLETKEFDSEPALVGIEHGVTVNLGNYESAKVTVSIRVPCQPKAVSTTYNQAKAWVEDRVKVEVDRIRTKYNAR